MSTSRATPSAATDGSVPGQTLVDADTARALQKATETLWSYFGGMTGIRYRSESDSAMFITGANSARLNGIVYSSIPAEVAEERVAELVAEFKRLALPFQWIIGDESEPFDLERRLAGHGLELGVRLKGMSLDLADAEYDDLPGPPAAVEILPVEDAETLDRWTTVYSECFHLTKEAEFKMRELYSSPQFDLNGPWRQFVAVFEGEVVGTSAVMIDGATACIWGVSVREDYRRDGIGTALTAVALDTGADFGAEVGILLSTDDAAPLYEVMGFTELTPITVMMWSGIDGVSVHELRARRAAVFNVPEESARSHEAGVPTESAATLGEK